MAEFDTDQDSLTGTISEIGGIAPIGTLLGVDLRIRCDTLTCVLEDGDGTVIFSRADFENSFNIGYFSADRSVDFGDVISLFIPKDAFVAAAGGSGPYDAALLIGFLENGGPPIGSAIFDKVPNGGSFLFDPNALSQIVSDPTGDSFIP